MSSTSDVNMINLVVNADHLVGSGAVSASPETSGWLSDQQTYPTGMDGDPVGYAQSLRDSLPLVNNLRIFFNENSFNADGTLHPDFTAFLVEAARLGFEFTLTYGTSNLQRTGEGGETEQEIYDELADQLPIALDAVQSMIDHVTDIGVSGAVYAYELINEPQAFNNGITAGGNDYGSVRSFVGLYLDYVTQMSALIQDQTDSHIMVGGLGYSRNFSLLTRGGTFEGMNALDYIRDVVGEDLIWSVHIYGIDGADSTDSIEAGLEQILDLVLQDNIIVTELNYANELTDNYEGGISMIQYYAQSYEWFADQGIGGGWYAGATTSASHLVDFDDRGVVIRNQGSFAHAYNLFSLGGEDSAHSGDEVITVDVLPAVLRNQDNITFDDADRGIAFGHAGNDVLVGGDTTNDFMYGGTGNDTLQGFGADDYLFGQDGDDLIEVTAGDNHLYGGRGNDTLRTGEGHDVLLGGSNIDHFELNGRGTVEIIDFDVLNEQINFTEGFSDFSQVQSAISAVDGDNDGAIDDVLIQNGNGTTTILYNVNVADLSQQNFVFGVAADGKIDGTSSDDMINGTYADGQGESVTDGANLIYGYEGNDTIYGLKGNDTIYGGAGDDFISGGKQNNQLFGEAGNDTLNSGDHASLLDGGSGNDHLVGEMSKGGGHILTGGLGADVFEFVYTSADRVDSAVITDFNIHEDTLIILGQEIDLHNPSAGYTVLEDADGVTVNYGDNDYIVLDGVTLAADGKIDGTSGDDMINGTYADGQGESVTDGANLIYGYEGNDTIYGLKGNDTIYGGAGDDFISGGKQNNQLFGEAGNDTLNSGDHASLLDGGSGNDHLVGEMSKGGGHILTGGLGADVFEFVYTSADRVDSAVITDFNIHEDTLIILGQEIDLHNPSAGYTVLEDADGVTINYGDNDYIVLDGVSLL